MVLLCTPDGVMFMFLTGSSKPVFRTRKVLKPDHVLRLNTPQACLKPRAGLVWSGLVQVGGNNTSYIWVVTRGGVQDIQPVQ